MNYLLDTNLLVIYVRNNQVTRRVEDYLNLLSADNTLVISVVSVGEIRSIAKRNGWGDQKMAKIDDLLSGFLVADINIGNIIERYAQIDAYSQGKLAHRPLTISARNMGKNDLWIAATASIYTLELVTTDRDFDHLKDQYLKLITVDVQEFQ